MKQKAKQIKWETTKLGWRIRFSYKSKQSYMGRFGGGWNWKVGFQSGGQHFIFSLLICEISISKVFKNLESVQK